MRNAKNETLNAIGQRIVDYGFLALERVYSDDPCYENEPKEKFDSHEDFLSKIDKFDTEYDAGYGGQEFYGCIVFTDGTWLTRGEYDGSEWWQNHIKPDKTSLFKASEHDFL